MQYVIRPLGIVLEIMGFFFLFSPLIALLSWIPLVGSLLGLAVWIVAAIFSLVVGGTLAILVIALAWMFYRPLFTIGCLLVVGVSVTLIFMYPFDEEEAAALATEAPHSDLDPSQPLIVHQDTVNALYEIFASLYQVD